ncbi:MAG TPA: glycosyltransferase [Anaerolineae bacterium]|nr:glycosyltransferase [Anaerolineae bacterium]
MIILQNLQLSVIVPVYNAAGTLENCLTALENSTFQAFDLIVVDDGSVDNSAEIARTHNATVLSATGTKPQGPAAARNYGASHAKTDLLVFIDADCVVQPTTLAQFANYFSTHPHIAAVFGSYDDTPAAPNFISQYKNLTHHFTHQQSPTQVNTFWAGCGAIRRNWFEQIAGFNAHRYPHPAIEDIELGYRLSQAGGQIHLAKSIQVKHLKQWTLFSMLKSDIWDRALPWSKLLLTVKPQQYDLNLAIHQQLSALLFLSLPFITIFTLWLLPITMLIFLGLNNAYYRFMLRKRGILFALKCVPMQCAYFSYAITIYVWQKSRFILSKVDKQ